MEKLIQLGSDMSLLWSNYSSAYLGGIRSTLILALVATVIGCVIGLICGILNTIPYNAYTPKPRKFLLKLIRLIIRVYVEVFRGTPMVLQAVFIYYGLPYFSGNTMRFNSLWVAAILIVSINTGAYMAESVRGGIISIDPGQTEGAKAIGMTHVQTMTSVILPQALRNIMPQIGNNFIINVKDTSVMFIIGFTEFFAFHRYITGVNKSRVRNLSSRKLAFYVFIVSTVLFAIKAATNEGIQPIPDALSVGNLVLLAVVPTVVSNITLVLAIRHIGGTMTSVLGAMEPLTAVVIGVCIFNEAFTMQEATGILLIIVAVTIIILSDTLKKTLSQVLKHFRPHHS